MGTEYSVLCLLYKLCLAGTVGVDLHNISLDLYVGDLCGLIIVRLSPYNLLC